MFFVAFAIMVLKSYIFYPTTIDYNVFIVLQCHLKGLFVPKSDVKQRFTTTDNISTALYSPFDEQSFIPESNVLKTCSDMTGSNSSNSVTFFA